MDEGTGPYRGPREEPLRSDVETLGDGAAYAVGDVTSPEDRSRWLAEVKRLHGAGPSILVNNAGHNIKTEAAKTSVLGIVRSRYPR